MRSDMIPDWDTIYEQHGYMLSEPHSDMPKVIALFRERNVRRVLDLGCGTGRHLVYLAGLGFRAYGIDNSEKAIELAGGWLRERGLRAELRVGSMFERLPYEGGFFDAVICNRVLNHGTIEDIQRAIGEMGRVLKPGGVAFVEVHKERETRPSRKQALRSILIGDRTLVPIQGREKGVVHYQFNKAILLGEFGSFRILDFWVDSHGYYCLIAEPKSRTMG